MEKHSDYRPIIVPMGSGDELKDADSQARIDQMLEAAIDMRDGELRDQIYAAAQLFIEATEVLGIKKRRSQQERRLDVDRVATGIAFMLGTSDLEVRRQAVELSLEELRPRATNSIREKFLKEQLEPVFYRVHGLEPPQ